MSSSLLNCVFRIDNHWLKSDRWLANLLMLIVCLFAKEQQLQAQTPWEYTPYRVNVWMSVSSNVGWDEEAELNSHRIVLDRIESSMGGVWKARVQSTPDSLYGSVLERIDELTIQQVLAREMILVVGKSDAAKARFLELNPPPPPVKLTQEEEAKRAKMSKRELQELQDAAARAASLNSVRTFESALERVNEFSVLSLPYAGIQRDVQPFLSDPKWKKFLDKLRPYEGSLQSLSKDLEEGKIIGALIGKTESTLIRDSCRTIPARLPWQPETLLKDFDKIFLVSIDRVEEMYRVRLKELDCIIRRLGPLASMTVVRRQDIPIAVEYLLRNRFNPVVRIEENDNSTAVMRVRAAGLINRDNHPASFGIGDVLIPHIRRDDTNGNPTMIQTLPFTYIVATEKIDQLSLFYGAIFTARKGSLAAAKNRRTVRLAMKVPPVQGTTELKLSFREAPIAGKLLPSVAVPGAELYLRTPGHDDLVMLGRTDWRGITQIRETKLPIIKYDIPSQSRNPSIAEARNLVSDPVPPPDYPLPPIDDSVPPKSNAPPTPPKDGEDSSSKPKSDGETNVAATTEASQAPSATPSKPAKGEVKSNLPLYLYYVKNGDTLLARLPMITGLQPLEEAKLPDDRKRLEAEAFLKGVQNEVLDIVVRRKILESRIKTRIDKKQIAEASENLEIMKRLKSYEKLFSEVEAIQRKALATEVGKANPSLVTKVENMVSATRQMIQNWLQNTLINDLEKKIEQAK